MEIPLPPALEAELAETARRAGRTPQEFAIEVVSTGLEAEKQYLQAVERGIADIDAGRFVEDDVVRAWLNQFKDA